MHTNASTRDKIHLTFIGGGTMACAILDGLARHASGVPVTSKAPTFSLSITARRQDHVDQLARRYPEAYVANNNDDEQLWHFATDYEPDAHIVIICTKPQSTFEVCESIRIAHEKQPASCRLPIVVTMCPGITISRLQSWLSPQEDSRPFAIVRTMPNTPVSICQGATAMVANRRATAENLDCVTALFRIVSPCVEILPHEDLLNVAAAVSGSGPAYIFQFYKSLVAAGVQWGLSENLARSLIMQTGIGASMLANDEPDIPLSRMISNVCVPGGSTEKGIRSLVDAGLQVAVTNAVSISLEANHKMKGREAERSSDAQD